MEGRATRFLNSEEEKIKIDAKGDEYADEEDIDVQPKTDSILVFEHKILHQGCTIQKNQKYTMRTDVMYQ